MQVHQRPSVPDDLFPGVHKHPVELDPEPDVVTASTPDKLALPVATSADLSRIASAVLKFSLTARPGY